MCAVILVITDWLVPKICVILLTNLYSWWSCPKTGESNKSITEPFQELPLQESINNIPSYVHVDFGNQRLFDAGDFVRQVLKWAGTRLGHCPQNLQDLAGLAANKPAATST